jgi:hypothetical protein
VELYATSHKLIARSIKQTGALMIFDTIPNDPPPDWMTTTPKYRVSRDLRPADKARYRLEPPFAQTSDSDTWQYGERELKAGEVIESREWPHPSFRALNYGAVKVLEFFNLEIKSRLPRSPWNAGQLRLDNGLTGNIVTGGFVGVTTPKLQPMDLSPIS